MAVRYLIGTRVSIRGYTTYKNPNDRILRDACEVCGSVMDVEVRHVRNLSANMRMYVNRTTPDWLRLMWG